VQLAPAEEHLHRQIRRRGRERLTAWRVEEFETVLLQPAERGANLLGRQPGRRSDGIDACVGVDEHAAVDRLLGRRDPNRVEAGSVVRQKPLVETSSTRHSRSTV
jgi:hypothetical protein